MFIIILSLSLYCLYFFLILIFILTPVLTLAFLAQPPCISLHTLYEHVANKAFESWGLKIVAIQLASENAGGPRRVWKHTVNPPDCVISLKVYKMCDKAGLLLSPDIVAIMPSLHLLVY